MTFLLDSWPGSSCKLLISLWWFLAVKITHFDVNGGKSRPTQKHHRKKQCNGQNRQKYSQYSQAFAADLPNQVPNVYGWGSVRPAYANDGNPSFGLLWVYRPPKQMPMKGPHPFNTIFSDKISLQVEPINNLLPPIILEPENDPN